MVKLKFIQANLQFSKLATQETLNYISANNIDIALLQEPYCYNNGRKFQIPSSSHLRVISKSPDRFYSCIIINNKHLQVLHHDHISTYYLTVISLSLGPGFPLISFRLTDRRPLIFNCRHKNNTPL